MPIDDIGETQTNVIPLFGPGRAAAADRPAPRERSGSPARSPGAAAAPEELARLTRELRASRAVITGALTEHVRTLPSQFQEHALSIIAWQIDSGFNELFAGLTELTGLQAGADGRPA